MDEKLRALNRFGLGARVGERARVGDARRWLHAQLRARAPRLEAPAGNSREEIGAALRALRMTAQGNQRERQQARQRLLRIAAADLRATLTARVTSDQPFVERLVAFWSNHLCVSAGAKLLVAPLAGSYEREAIRPFVLGRFEDMLLASARHPAMLYYLDNFQSIGPNSQAARGRRRRGPSGLNENYARELLELHTLGVEGGYTQQDVLELARILTGWSTDRDLAFSFRSVAHEPGSKTVLAMRYDEAGVAEGERAIRALCRHPSTARFIATKLVGHFVSDDPPVAAVARIAEAFRDSAGDLAVVSAALVDMPEAWSDQARKFRTPQDWLVAVLRAFNAPEASDAVAPVLRQLRHPLWSPQAPKGFGDTTQEWADPDSLLNRAELARTIARRFVRRGADPRALTEVIAVETGDPLPALLADSSIPADERVALAIAGPAFQWR